MFLGLRTPVRIETALPIGEVAERLRRSIEAPSILHSIFGYDGICGRVNPDRCWLENRALFQRANRRLTLCYEDHPNGTVLTGSFFLPPIQAFPLGFFLLLCSVFCAISANHFFHEWTATGRVNWFALLPFGLPVVALCILKLNLWMGRGREQEILDTLQEIFAPVAIRRLNVGEVVIRPRRRMP
jgi:hypothetical protein